MNRAIVHTLNLMLVFVFAGAGRAWRRNPRSSPPTRSGGTLFLGAGFWLLRTALQPMMFRLRHWASKLLFVVFVAGVALHAAPAWP